MKKLAFIAFSALLFSCGNAKEKNNSSNDSASIVMIDPGTEFTNVLDETMNNLAKKDVAAAISSYADSIQFVHPSGAITKTKQELESALSSRISQFSSLSYHDRVYIAFDVKKPRQKNVTPGVYVTGWMWSTVKNAKGDSVVSPMTLTIHFNKDKKVDFGYSTYDLKGRTDLMAK
ncbi:MAG: hypothetical protein RJA76_533 [Bacteroidota bacterium]|jgi:predicted nucleic acid-binding protein